MTLYLFKYCLPLLLGYTLFIGLAGRMNPFAKPEYPEERPSWFLGVWTGLTVALVLGVGMHMAYSISLESATALLPTTALFMGVLLLPGFAGYSLYRRHISRELREAPFSMAPESNGLKHRLESDARWRANEHRAEDSEESDATLSQTSADSSVWSMKSDPDEDQHAPIVAAFLESAELDVLDTHDQTAANGEQEEAFEAYLGPDFDLDNETTLDDYLDDTVFEEFHYSDLEMDATQLDATSLIDMSDIAGVQISESTGADDSALSLFDETEFTQANALSEIEQSFSSLEMSDDEFTAAHEQFMATQDENHEETLEQVPTALALDDIDLTQSRQDLDQSHDTNEPETAITGSYATSVSNLQLGQRLSDELAAHEETSRQLRITRKVLARLTPSAQEGTASPAGEPEDTDSLVQLKEELAASIAMQASLQSEANREKEKRLQSEEAGSRLREELIQAKHDIRRSSAARAKALSTANKAIAFARQTLQVRALLEEELQMARNTLSKRQDTISSVIRELENEKERTQEEVAFMAQQLVVHDHLPQHHHDDELTHDDRDHTLPVAPNGKISEIHQSGPEL